MKQKVFSPHGDFYIQYCKSNDKHNMSIQHYHDAYEIYFQISGKRYVFFDNTCYTMNPGDVTIFKPFEIHYAQSRDSDSYERYVINFKEEIFKDILSQEEIYILLKKLNSGIINLSSKQSKELYENFKRVEYFKEQTGFLSEKLLHSALLQLIMFLLQFNAHFDEYNEAKIELIVVDAI